MPRRSRAALATVPAAQVPREPPPAHLSKDEAAEWRKVVDGLPPFWIPAGSFVLLEIYCSSIVNMRACRAVMLAAPEGSPRYAIAARLYRQEAAQVVKLAKMLRIGPRHDRTKLRSVANLPRPWELLGGASAHDGRVFGGWEEPAKEKPDEPEDSPPTA